MFYTVDEDDFVVISTADTRLLFEITNKISLKPIPIVKKEKSLKEIINSVSLKSTKINEKPLFYPSKNPIARAISEKIKRID